MALHLKIESEANLPAEFESSAIMGRTGSFVIGRGERTDWKLPDPQRQISNRHCEILREGDAFILHDRSTNGTFVNGEAQRVLGPHHLVDGDRITIGSHVIAISLVDEPAAELGDDRSPVESDVWGRGRISSVSTAPDPAPAGPASRQPPSRGGDPAAMVMAAGSPVLARSSDEATSPSHGAAAHPAMTIIRPAPKPVPKPAPVSTPAPPPAPVEQGQALDQTTADEILSRAAQGLGLPVEALMRQDPAALVEELGALVRVAVGELKTLLDHRANAMREMRSKRQTAIGALDNNPLKLSPTTEHALALLFGAKSKSYLDALPAFEMGFADIKTHQSKLTSGLLAAMRQLALDLDPKEVERQLPSGRTLLSTTRKARLWDQYVANWQRHAGPNPGELSASLLRQLGDAYDESN